MNKGKVVSGFAALAIYLGFIVGILFFYNIHQTKAKNYVEKNDNRITVTLVNSDKTVLNRSDESSNENKPTAIIPSVPLKTPQKVEPVKSAPKVEQTIPPVVIPKKIVPKKVVPKKVVKPKKIVPKKVVPKKKTPPKKAVPKKVVPKKVVPKKKIPKKVVPKKVVPKKKVPKKTAKDLFSTVKTKDVSKRPVKKTPKKQPSSIKHSSSVTDRIKSSHQSGTSSNANRDKGIKNAYISKVKRKMNNWDAGSAHKGQRVKIALTIYNSGKFSYRIISGQGNIRSSLSQYLDRLKRIGLGRHSKSTPYSIQVSFTVR